MCNNYFLSRRSCRNFKPDKIDSATIENIILKAIKAPTCGNMQLYSVVVTQDQFQKEKLASLHFNQPAALTAPVILTICADFNRFSKWCEVYKAEAGYNNFHSFLMAATDAIIFAQQITTIAELDGLCTCYLGSVTYNARQISDLLELPDLVIPVISLAIGFPSKEGEETKRLPLNGIVHYESYKRYSDKEIMDIFKVHDEDPANKKFITENRKQNLAQVFAEVRYPKKDNEKISSDFLELLKDKEFLNKK